MYIIQCKHRQGTCPRPNQRLEEMADEISLSDHYVVLLESVVNQTTLLREEIQKDKENDKGVLENITNTLDGLSNSVRSLTVANRGRRVRQSRGRATTRVPKLCSVSIFHDLRF